MKALHERLGGDVSGEALRMALDELRRLGLAECRTIPPGLEGGRPAEEWRVRTAEQTEQTEQTPLEGA